MLVTAGKTHYDLVNFYKRKHLIGGLLTVSQSESVPSWQEGWQEAGMALEQ